MSADFPLGVVGAVFTGVVLGALGGAFHLMITNERARGLPTRGVAATMAMWPLGLVGPAAAVWLAARLAPQAAWASVLGLVLVRAIVLRRARKVMGGGVP